MASENICQKNKIVAKYLGNFHFMQNIISHFPTQESVQSHIFKEISEIIPNNKNKILEILENPTMQIFQRKILQEQRRTRPNEDLIQIYEDRIMDFSKNF